MTDLLTSPWRGTPTGAVPPSLRAIIRRSVILAGHDIDALQDQRDAAELLAAAGWHEASGLLESVVAIRCGLPRPGHLQDRPRQMVACAVADLRTLLAIGGLQPLPPAVSAIAEAAPAVVGMGRGPALPPDFVTLVSALRSALAFDGEHGGERADLLARVRVEVAERPAFDLVEVGSVPALAARLAFNSLRRWALMTDQLAHPPFGSPDLLAAAAALDDEGLGPYFRNLPNLRLEDGALLGLIGLAGGADLDHDCAERWSLLLSVGLEPQQMGKRVDELADAGLMRAIAGMLVAATLRGERPNRAFLWRVRDAALGGGEWALAARAQQAVTTGWPLDPIEWVILADLCATQGDLTGVEDALGCALRLGGDTRPAAERLDALRTGDVARFALRTPLMPSPRPATAH